MKLNKHIKSFILSSFYIIICLATSWLISCKPENEQQNGTKVDSLSTKDSISNISDTSQVNKVDTNFEVGTTLSSYIVKKHLLKSINEKKLKKNVKLSILGSMKKQPSIELKNYILLANESNTIIDRTALTKEGRFKFEKLQAGSYNILIEKPIKGLEIDIETKFVDESTLLPEENQENLDFSINKILSAAFIQKHLLYKLPSAQVKLKQGDIDGIITAKENEPLDNLEILLVDDDNKIISKTKTNAQGKFSFKKLPAGNYNLLLRDQNPNITAKLLESQDNANIALVPEEIKLNINSILPASFVQKNKIGTVDKNLFRDDYCNLKGKITGSSNSHTIIITDLSNKIIRITKSLTNGGFNFDKLPYGDYNLLIENKPSGIKVEYKVETDQSEILEPTTNNFNFEINTKVPKNIIAANGLGEMEVGNVKNITGYFHENIGKQKKAIPNEELFIVDSQDKIIAKTTSDGSGKFGFSKLNSGKYTIIGKRTFSRMNIGLDLSFKQNNSLEENQN